MYIKYNILCAKSKQIHLYYNIKKSNKQQKSVRVLRIKNAELRMKKG